MNIFNKVALQGLIKNRTRTVVTIIGVALAAALFTGVATFAVSLQDYMVRGAEGKYGSWHLEVFQADTSFAEQQAGNSKVAQAVSFENIGYAILEGGQNADKPYLFLAGFHEDTFSVLPVNLLYGRLPENSGEVLVSSHVENNGGVKFSVGDTLTLPVGERQTDGRVLSQHDPFQGGEETLAATEVKTYTVVGICQRPAFEMRSAPGYTLITKADGSTPAESQTVFLDLKEPAQSRSFAKNSLVGCVYTQNDDVLRFLGASDDTLFNTLLYSIGGVLLILIMTGSVFMIYNSFNISLSERTHQFGILMSVGATARQLRGSVLFEGLCIGVIGIPLGILLGIPSIKLVLDLVSKNFSNIMYDNVALALRLSVPALIGAAVVSLITILISAYIPAKKAAAMPVMECIRQTNEIKVDAKSMRPSRLSRRFLGLDETLALKNFKRNKGRYRSIILSLTFSVVLFVGSSYFKTCFVTLSNQAKVVTDFDINLDAPAMTGEGLTALCDHLKGAAGVTHASCRTTLECTGTVPANALTDAYWQAAGQQPPVDSVDLVATVMILSDDFYEQIVKNLGLSVEEYTGPTGKRIAVGKMEASGYVEGPDDLSDMFASSSLHVTLTPWDGDGLKLESTEVDDVCCKRCISSASNTTYSQLIRGRMKWLMKGMAKMAELTYTKVGDYYIPDLILDEGPATEKFYGKYGDLRRTYLQKHKPKLWMVLVNTGRADDHLTSIERAAERRMDMLLPQMMKAAGVTEELKARDQMAWVGLMNCCKAQVEEIIFSELGSVHTNKDML